MPPLAIAQVTPYPWEDAHEVNTHVGALAAELARRGHRVLILAPSHSPELVRESRRRIRSGDLFGNSSPPTPTVLAVGELLPTLSPRRAIPSLPVDIARTIEELLDTVELDIVHGVPNIEAVKRYRDADIVIDQVLRDWHGLFTIESMAMGKPVVTSLDEEAVRRTEEAFGLEMPVTRATKDDLAERLWPLVRSFEERKRIGAESRAYVEQVHDIDKMADRLLQIYAGL